LRLLFVATKCKHSRSEQDIMAYMNILFSLISLKPDLFY
jgi:hypothetical protein